MAVGAGNVITTRENGIKIEEPSQFNLRPRLGIVFSHWHFWEGAIEVPTLLDNGKEADILRRIVYGKIEA